MKAITLWQPWASLVDFKEKKNETRSWATSYRGPLAIHAAANFPKDVSGIILFTPNMRKVLNERMPSSRDIYCYPKRLPLGCILAICNLTDCQKVVSLEKENGKPVLARLENGETIEGNELFFGDYTPGRFAWKLENVHSLAKPIEAKGHQRLWNWDETPHLVAIDPYVCGPTKIWTPKGICTGQQVEPGKEDSMIGLEVMA